MATQLNILKKAAMTGDWAAMSAYADCLEENNGDKALIVGLRFCIKHKKFPANSRFWPERVIWSFVGYKTKVQNWLPIYFNYMSPFYKSKQEAIKAVGKFIIKVTKDFKEVI
jgi:hypothetical protein